MDVASWREVAAEGFTFCVPPEWRGSGRSWRWRGAEITWGQGTHPREEVATAVVTVAASEVGSLPSGPPPNSDVRRFAEEIGGRRADMWRNRFGREYYTGAEWESARVWIVGKTTDASIADLQVAIFRTVRFRSR